MWCDYLLAKMAGSRACLSGAAGGDSGFKGAQLRPRFRAGRSELTSRLADGFVRVAAEWVAPGSGGPTPVSRAARGQDVRTGVVAGERTWGSVLAGHAAGWCARVMRDRVQSEVRGVCGMPARGRIMADSR